MTHRLPIRKVHFITTPHGLEYGRVDTAIYSTPPAAFLWLSAYLESKGIECRILDAYTKMLDLETILADIEAYMPDVVGLSVFTIVWYDNAYLARKIKERFPDILVVMGGYHVNHSYEEVLECEAVDYCLPLEGEVSLHELIQCLNAGDDPRKVDGLAWVENGNMVTTTQRSPRQDINEIPRFPYHKLMDHHYVPWCFSHSPRDRYMATVTSRGCPNQCVFCDIGQTEGRRFRHFTAERVADDMEFLHTELGVNQIEFVDALFTTHNKRVIELCAILKERGLDLEWACASAIRFTDNQKMLDAMADAGCKKIFYGIESGNPEILQRVKRITPDKVRKVIGMTKKAGILSHASFIFGLPGDTPETMEDTLAFAKSLNTDTASFSMAIPFKGTELYELYKDKIFTTDYREYQRAAVFRVDEYEPEYLEKMLIRAHREYYLRIRYVLSRLNKIKSWHDLWVHMRIGMGFLLGKIRYKRGSHKDD